MMVTVKGPPRNLRTIECKGCSYILEYGPKDVTHYDYDTETGDPAQDFITCPRPECRQRTDIKSPTEDY
jgi:hypothetical protein